MREPTLGALSLRFPFYFPVVRPVFAGFEVIDEGSRKLEMRDFEKIRDIEG